MFTYEGGVLIAFLFWFYSAIILIVSINSTFERNLNRIGERISWLSLRPKLMQRSDLSRSWIKSVLRYLLIVGFGLPWVLLSWLYVVWAIGAVIYVKAKDAGAPQSIREFRWKMRNADLTFDQAVRELMKASEEDMNNFESYRANLIGDMESRELPVPPI